MTCPTRQDLRRAAQDDLARRKNDLARQDRVAHQFTKPEKPE